MTPAAPATKPSVRAWQLIWRTLTSPTAELVLLAAMALLLLAASVVPQLPSEIAADAMQSEIWLSESPVLRSSLGQVMVQLELHRMASSRWVVLLMLLAAGLYTLRALSSWLPAWQAPGAALIPTDLAGVNSPPEAGWHPLHAHAGKWWVRGAPQNYRWGTLLRALGLALLVALCLAHSLQPPQSARIAPGEQLVLADSQVISLTSISAETDTPQQTSSLWRAADQGSGEFTLWRGWPMLRAGQAIYLVGTRRSAAITVLGPDDTAVPLNAIASTNEAHQRLIVALDRAPGEQLVAATDANLILRLTSAASQPPDEPILEVQAFRADSGERLQHAQFSGAGTLVVGDYRIVLERQRDAAITIIPLDYLALGLLGMLCLALGLVLCTCFRRGTEWLCHNADANTWTLWRSVSPTNSPLGRPDANF
ncbi:MAG: hypothetical protein GXY52_08190 [Chloroflexi bacterium]|nr:hypothetical protein [Chloroflexota bacterium]